MQSSIKKREYRVNDEEKQKIAAGDVKEFHKISNPEEVVAMKVTSIGHFKYLDNAIASYFEEDFGSRYPKSESAVQSFYRNEYCRKEDVAKNGMVVFEIEKYQSDEVT